MQVNFTQTYHQPYRAVGYSPSLLYTLGDTYMHFLLNFSPVKDTIVVNDRWGKGCSCTHGGYYSCSDRYNPRMHDLFVSTLFKFSFLYNKDKLQSHKWENAFTVDKSSWGFRREAVYNNFLTIEEILEQIVSTVR